MKKKAQSASTYDELFAAGGVDGAYGLPARRSPYYPLWRSVLAELRALGRESVLEVGCGSGAFADLVLSETQIRYRGFDFSEVAVRQSIERTGHPELFSVGNALDKQAYDGRYDSIVCTEVLEHLPGDLDVVRRWPKGVTVVCSVPNYDSPYHERYFSDEESVLARYGQLIDISQVRRIKKPLFTDLAWSTRLRELRWSRYRPRRLAGLLGFLSFEEVGGWFLFSGTRK